MAGNQLHLDAAFGRHRRVTSRWHPAIMWRQCVTRFGVRWPEVVELRDIVIGPILSGNTKGRIVISADPPSPNLNHLRAASSQNVLEVIPFEHRPGEAVDVVEEPVIFAGPVFRHFGHCIAESTHRLWPRFALRDLRTAKVVFLPLNGVKVMPYVAEALNLYGIGMDDVLRIDRPTRFRRLFVGPQGRQLMGSSTIPGYRRLLDPTLERRFGRAGGPRRVYISRKHHSHTGSYYGESYIERALSEAGFEIIHPEQYGVREMVRILRSSSLAVFAEGSAIHTLELCGSGTPSVFVIGRRPLCRTRFQPLLSDICRQWMVSDRILLNTGLSANPKKHSGLLDLGAVLQDLRNFSKLAVGCEFHRADAVAAVQRDLEQHLADPRVQRAGNNDRLSEAIRRDVNMVLERICP
jgi:hypothetical protein